MKRHLLTSALLMSILQLMMAQNPIIHDQFTADPTARVFNGKVYLYPSHDIKSPIDKLKDWFCMADYHVFSSDNLTDWKDHGIIVSQENVPWVNSESYTMWAPDCVEKDGKYYFYFPAGPKGEERGFRVGVAVGQSPEGPFMPMRKPIEGIMGIDPCVLIDDDGVSYIYWSGMGMKGAKLSDDMLSLACEPVTIEGLPEGFKEGPFVFKRNGKYYFTFPWVKDKTETLAYAMGDSPLGPFSFKGLVMDESPTGCWTNHHSIVEYDGQWYLFYHHNDYSPEFDKNRSARIDTISFNPDGTIVKVTPTLRGVGISDARSRIQIDRYSDISDKGVNIDYLDNNDYFEGWYARFDKKGAWLTYNKVNFGDKPVKEISARVKAPKGGKMSVFAEDNGKKTKIASVKIPTSAGWTTVSDPVEADAPSGIRNLYIQSDSSTPICIDWVGFDALPWTEGAFKTGKYRNLFAEVGYSQKDVDARLDTIFQSLFYGKDRVYFEVGDSMGYVSDLKNHDVRTEGMSYGMMAAVQLDKKDIFDRIWRWARKYMQHADGDYKGYFAWSCKTDGTPNSYGAASDGELYFVTSLIFASNRWGNDTGIDYIAEARNIIDNSMQKVGKTRVAPLINLEHRLITFTPDNWGGRFTDPSYHVPAFYEVWAEWLGDGRSEFWRDCAIKGRQLIRSCINPQTGLNPDYCNFDGSLMGSRHLLGDTFRFDSWRVPMNVALDYSWACSDAKWQTSYADLIQNFLYSKGIGTFLDQYNTDGTDVEQILGAGDYKALRHSLGFVATSAAVSLAASDIKSREFIHHFWDSRHEPYSDGYFDAYYDGFLRLFAFMHLSGNYRIITPQNTNQ
ncbi:MAG: glycosyl hydrolase family 8 [Muribaculum sp.]|nr:glycosyl hydrolase family 8 [Muribaculum sp.]